MTDLDAARTPNTLSEGEKLVYIEAGNWVRMGNTITWSMTVLFYSIAVAPIYLAMTTAADRFPLAVFSLVVAGFWVAVDFYYERSIARARQILTRMEADARFNGPAFYTEQAGTVPVWWSIAKFNMLLYVGLIGFWFYISRFPPVRPLVPA